MPYPLIELTNGGHVVPWSSMYPYIPSFEPHLFETANCGHVRLPEFSVCGACGYRKWLTQWERERQLRLPLTRSALLSIKRGEFDLEAHRHSELHLVGARERDVCVTNDPDSPAKQLLIDAILCQGYEGFMWLGLSEADWAAGSKIWNNLSSDFDGASTNEWAECVGAYVPHPECIFANPWWVNRKCVPPESRRMDCLVALLQSIVSWYSKGIG